MPTPPRQRVEDSVSPLGKVEQWRSMLGVDPSGALRVAAENGSAEGVKLALERGADPKHVGWDGKSALMLAAHGAHPECVRMLSPLSEVDAVDGDGASALWFAAASSGEPFGSDCVKALLLAGADARIGNSSGSALMMAAERKSQASFELLLPCSEVSARSAYGQHVGSKVRLASMVRTLARAHPAYPWDADADVLPLIEAAQFGDASLIEAMLAHCDPKKADGRGRTPLMLAASLGKPPAMMELLASASDVNAKDSLGKSALASVVEMGTGQWREAAQVLLRHGADPNLFDEEGWTPLHHCIRKGQADMAELLLSVGALPGPKHGAPRTPLAMAKAEARRRPEFEAVVERLRNQILASAEEQRLAKAIRPKAGVPHGAAAGKRRL